MAPSITPDGDVEIVAPERVVAHAMAAQRVDRTDEPDLGVLALVAFRASRALSRAPSIASAVTAESSSARVRARLPRRQERGHDGDPAGRIVREL